MRFFERLLMSIERAGGLAYRQLVTLSGMRTRRGNGMSIEVRVQLHVSRFPQTTRISRSSAQGAPGAPLFQGAVHQINLSGAEYNLLCLERPKVSLKSLYFLSHAWKAHKCESYLKTIREYADKL